MQISLQTVFLALAVTGIHVAILLGGASTRERAAAWFQSPEFETMVASTLTKGDGSVLVDEGQQMVLESSEIVESEETSADRSPRNPLSISKAETTAATGTISKEAELPKSEETMTAVTDVRLLAGRIEAPTVDRYKTEPKSAAKKRIETVKKPTGTIKPEERAVEAIAVAKPVVEATPDPAATPESVGGYKVRAIRPISAR